MFVAQYLTKLNHWAELIPLMRGGKSKSVSSNWMASHSWQRTTAGKPACENHLLRRWWWIWRAALDWSPWYLDKLTWAFATLNFSKQVVAIDFPIAEAQPEIWVWQGSEEVSRHCRDVVDHFERSRSVYMPLGNEDKTLLLAGHT